MLGNYFNAFIAALLLCLAVTFSTWALYKWDIPGKGFNAIRQRNINSSGIEEANRTFLERDLPTVTESPDNSPSGIKPILLWDPFFQKPNFGLPIGSSVFHECNCSKWQCETTVNRSTFHTAAAVIFHGYGRKFVKFPENLPVRGHSDQIYGFHNMEAPTRRGRELKKFPDVFNLTMSYRRDSDIRVPYWRLVKKTKERQSTGMSLGKIMKKSRTAVWFISSCSRYGSQRWAYVSELSKYIDVDIYGDCGNFSCPRNKTDPSAEENCFREVSKTYYFYLAFENAFCKDYVTEKILHGWFYDMVPVVHGRFDDVLPTYSALDVRDFPSPRDLAEKMKSLRNNRTEYLKYFEFKKSYDIIRHDCDRGFCRLCEILHDPGYQYKSRFDVHQWWVGQGECWTGEETGQLLGLN